jgi:hypothetical protein
MKGKGFAAAGLLALALLPAPARAERALLVSTQVGFNHARFTGDIDESISGDKTGLALGVACHWRLTSFLTLQPEVSYTMKGNSYGTEVDPVVGGITYYGTYETMYALDYIEVPLLVRLAAPLGMVRPVLVGGPYLGWKVVEKFHINGPDDDDYFETTRFGKTFDLGYSAGAGFEIGSDTRMMTIEARYSESLTSCEKPEFNEDIRNRELRYSVGWKQSWQGIFSAP